MAADIVLLAAAPPELPGPDFPAVGASPVEHLRWCIRFGSYCTRQAQRAREFGLPDRKWLQAAEFAAVAASVWRARVERIA